MTTLVDLIKNGKGKSLLVTAASTNAATMMVREAFWKAGIELQVVDLEFLDPHEVEPAFAALQHGVMVIEAKRSGKETQEKLVEIMNNPDRVLVVAEYSIPRFMPPEKFSHWAKF